MTDSDRSVLSSYELLSAIDEEHGVYLVQHKRTKKIYVQKVLTVYSKAVYRQLQEHHVQGTPVIVEIVEDADKLIVIEEYINGQTLRSILEDGNRFTLDQAVAIVEQVCGIVGKLHNAVPPIIHRDIKPSNIMMDYDGNVKLLDMNAAKQSQYHQSQDTDLIGTVGYAAPEQYGFGASTPETDIYAIGVLLNEMITGVFPNERIPEGHIGEIIRKCTKMDPKDRYGSIQELLRDLQSGQKQGRTSQESFVTTNVSAPKNKNAIPGFRTGNPVHIAIALVGYMLIIVFAITLTVQGEQGAGLWFNRIMFLISEILIVAITCNYRNIWSRIGIAKSREKWQKILKIIIVDAVVFIGTAIVTTIIESIIRSLI